MTKSLESFIQNYFSRLQFAQCCRVANRIADHYEITNFSAPMLCGGFKIRRLRNIGTAPGFKILRMNADVMNARMYAYCICEI